MEGQGWKRNGQKKNVNVRSQKKIERGTMQGQEPDEKNATHLSSNGQKGQLVQWWVAGSVWPVGNWQELTG
jgi:hypothetical protein